MKKDGIFQFRLFKSKTDAFALFQRTPRTRVYASERKSGKVLFY